MEAVRIAVALGLAFLGVAAAGGCVAARDCAHEIRGDLRADAMRFALDRQMIREVEMSQEELALAYGAGVPADAMSRERQQEIAAPAAGWVACVRSRLRKD